MIKKFLSRFERENQRVDEDYDYIEYLFDGAAIIVDVSKDNEKCLKEITKRKLKIFHCVYDYGKLNESNQLFVVGKIKQVLQVPEFRGGDKNKIDKNKIDFDTSSTCPYIFLSCKFEFLDCPKLCIGQFKITMQTKEHLVYRIRNFNTLKTFDDLLDNTVCYNHPTRKFLNIEQTALLYEQMEVQEDDEE
jgi:hypothetical protein